jgi:type II secretory ATPase GspE/PulE/Tfp pilus assembly ATPase PilB-like protein
MPQDGRIKMAVRGQDVDFRVSTIPSLHGETVVLRILDRSAVVFDYARLGLAPTVIRKLGSALDLPNGIVLVTGPTGSGKTTTLYTGLLALNAITRKIVTVEDPIEYQLQGINQIQVRSQIGLTFASLLRSILRQDPDVIMIGEIRDQETATIACQAANTGHMVFSTVHSNDAVTSLFRLLDLGVEPFMISSALTAVLGQRLVRVLCEACKEPYKPKPEFLKKANLPVEKVDVFYRRPENPEQVCQQCGGTGYFGRTGIYELLVISEPVREMLRENPSINKIKAEARKNGMIYLQEDGLRQVIQGRTSIEELLRVVK